MTVVGCVLGLGDGRQGPSEKEDGWAKEQGREGKKEGRKRGNREPVSDQRANASTDSKEGEFSRLTT